MCCGRVQTMPRQHVHWSPSSSSSVGQQVQSAARSSEQRCRLPAEPLLHAPLGAALGGRIHISRPAQLGLHRLQQLQAAAATDPGSERQQASAACWAWPCALCAVVHGQLLEAAPQQSCREATLAAICWHLAPSRRPQVWWPLCDPAGMQHRGVMPPATSQAAGRRRAAHHRVPGQRLQGVAALQLPAGVVQARHVHGVASKAAAAARHGRRGGR